MATTREETPGMSPSERDVRAAYGYSQALRLFDGAKRRAMHFAMGREHRSESVFMESVRRGEDVVLAIDSVSAMREDFASIGMAESQARDQALEYGWALIVESRVDGSEAHLSEAEAVADRLGVSGLIEKGKRAKTIKRKSAGSRIVEIREPADTTARTSSPTRGAWRRPVPSPEVAESLKENFRRMGLSESAARDAAKGR